MVILLVQYLGCRYIKERPSIVFLVMITIIVTAEELVGSIKKAMEDEAMAANLERIHQIYMDREQKPVEKVINI